MTKPPVREPFLKPSQMSWPAIQAAMRLADMVAMHGIVFCQTQKLDYSKFSKGVVQ